MNDRLSNPDHSDRKLFLIRYYYGGLGIFSADIDGSHSKLLEEILPENREDNYQISISKSFSDKGHPFYQIWFNKGQQEPRQVYEGTDSNHIFRIVGSIVEYSPAKVKVLLNKELNMAERESAKSYINLENILE